MLVAGISTAMAVPLATQASDGTITFTGAVTANTCTVSVNSGISGATGGAADATVVLPIVSTAALTGAAQVAGPPVTAAKTTAAGTFFSMTLSACVATHADIGGVVPTYVNIYFEAGPNVDVLTGGLINSGASNVEVNLYNASAAAVVGSQIMPGTTTGQNPHGSGMAAGTGGTQYYYAGYATAPTVAALPGAVSTSVTYSLVYQ
jgi:major type 1 subunit fimbrin (pilin)